MPTVVRPETVDGIRDALRDSNGRIAVRGAGSKRNWGGVTEAADLVVDTSGCRGVLEHSPGDLVATVTAGTALSELQPELAQHGQRLAIDPFEPGATVGGVLAAAASGPRRLRYGTPRDLLLGVTVVLSDGTVARSGGKVVKNVAGYDLGKLFSGSFGTLGVIATATLRLHPMPAARCVVSVDCARPAEVLPALRAVDAVPSAAEWDGRQVHVLVESTPAATEAQASALAAVLGGETVDALPPCFTTRPWADGDVALKATFRLSRLEQALAELRAVLPTAALSAHVGVGVAWAVVAPDDIDDERLSSLRTAMARHGGTVVIASGPEESRRRLDVWGPVAGLDIMRRIKAQFDPDGRIVPGRFVGGI